jgi:hypothetical protein
LKTNLEKQMKLMLTAALVLSLTALAACDRPRTDPQPKTGAASGATSEQGPKREAAMPSNPANAGVPTPGEKREGSNPVQGQVDPKQPDQQRDFKQGGNTSSK